MYFMLVHVFIDLQVVFALKVIITFMKSIKNILLIIVIILGPCHINKGMNLFIEILDF